MPEHLLLGIASVVVLGVGAQWVAWRLGLPSILMLLIFGFLAGPVSGLVFEGEALLDPDALFGDLLFPLISISVALILYEGGLTLSLKELPQIGNVVRNLVSVGALLTWGVSALAAWLIFPMGAGVAILLGAILVVTGPTVIGPLLRHIRPAGAVGPALKWEGIVIDPIGATLAVLVFEVLISAGAVDHATWQVALAVGKTVVIGGGLGFIAAGLLIALFKGYLIPDYLQNAVSLMFVVAVFAASNALQHESGLLAVTVMGVAIANQNRVDVRHIVEFKENLRVLLISALFILLAARLDLAALQTVAWGGLAFVAVLILVARPLSVAGATLGSKMNWRERAFLASMAPRGIVAAAVSALFQIRLREQGYESAELLVPVTFVAIIGTVAFYGLTSPLIARRLGLSEANPQGLLIIGAHSWARAMAKFFQEKGFRVLLVDSNRTNINAARLNGLPNYSGSILAEYALDEINLGGLGRVLALTRNDYVNMYAVQRLAGFFGKANCYQLAPQKDPAGKKAHHKHLHGRWLFGPGITYSTLEQRYNDHGTIKATPITEEYTFEDFRRTYGADAVPLAILNGNKRLTILTDEKPPEPASGQTLISLVKADPREEAKEAAEKRAEKGNGTKQANGARPVFDG